MVTIHMHPQTNTLSYLQHNDIPILYNSTDKNKNKKTPQQNRQNKLYINYVLLIFVLKLCNIVTV